MSKSTGVASELLFRYECIKKGIVPSIPDIDDGAGFDVVTSHESKLYKIQIKSTNTKENTGYRVSCSKGSATKKRYTKEHCDFVAVYIIERKVWFIIPIDKIKSININVYPDKINHRYSCFQNAWWLLAN